MHPLNKVCHSYLGKKYLRGTRHEDQSYFEPMIRHQTTHGIPSCFSSRTGSIESQVTRTVCQCMTGQELEMLPYPEFPNMIPSRGKRIELSRDPRASPVIRTIDLSIFRLYVFET